MADKNGKNRKTLPLNARLLHLSLHFAAGHDEDQKVIFRIFQRKHEIKIKKEVILIFYFLYFPYLCSPKKIIKKWKQ